MTELEKVPSAARVNTAGAFGLRSLFLAALFAATVALAPPAAALAQQPAQTAPATDARASVISSLPAKPDAAADDKAIRPFRVNIPEAELLKLRRLYWLTNSAISSAQLYWENNTNNFNSVEQKTADIAIPVAVTVFPGEIYQAPRSWTERAYRKLIYFNEVDKGGHFAAWEEPELFAAELRAAFRSLR